MEESKNTLDKLDIVRLYLNNNFTFDGDVLIFTFPTVDSLNKFKLIFENIKMESDDTKIFLKGSNIIDLLGTIYSVKSNDKLYKLLCSLATQNELPYLIWFKNNENAIEPSKAHYSDVGYDLTIIKKVKDLGENTAMYDTGISIQIPLGYKIEISPRSSLSKSGYILSNSTGIIDVGYTGNLFICLTKTDKSLPDLTLPFKCCQMILQKCEYSHLIQGIKDLEINTSRKNGGFGSSDKKE